MKKEYDIITAKHYAAYRPLLHQIILKKCIKNYESFQLGLDIGCGTGQSAIALSNYCRKVIGIDSSPDMIEIARPHPKVDYILSDGIDLNFDDNSFDIITFAGSLFYAKTQKLLTEVIRVSKNNSNIIIYDFEVLVQDIYSALEIKLDKPKIIYDHKINFSGLKFNGLYKTASVKDKIYFKISHKNLAHLLLSVKSIRTLLEEKFKAADPFLTLVENLSMHSNNLDLHLPAEIYYTKYQKKKVT